MKVSVLITTAGKFRHFPPANGEKYTLEELQKAVGGNIEIIRTPKGQLMIIDEEGKFKDKGINWFASDVLVGIIGKNDVVVGDVVYCDPSLVD